MEIYIQSENEKVLSTVQESVKGVDPDAEILVGGEDISILTIRAMENQFSIADVEERKDELLDMCIDALTTTEEQEEEASDSE